MHPFEVQLFNKAKKLIRGKLKKFRQFESFIIDYNFHGAIRAIEDLEENLNDILIFYMNHNHQNLRKSIEIEIEQVEQIKNEALKSFEQSIVSYKTHNNPQSSFVELKTLINQSKTIVKIYYNDFVKTINKLTQNFHIIANYLAIQDRLRDVYYYYRNLLNNLENFEFIITVDNANRILIENFEKLHFSIAEHYHISILLAKKIIKMSKNPCMIGQNFPGCPQSDESSSDEEEILSLTSVKSKEKHEEKKTSECFQESAAEHTRVDSIEKLETNVDHLKLQIASIKEEIERVNQTIYEKKSDILSAILEIVKLEEIIEDIETGIADELYEFQVKVRSIETQLMENFKGDNSIEKKEELEEELKCIKMNYNEKSHSDNKNYSDLAKQAKIFASSIGDVVQEYQKLHDDSHEKYDYNIQKLNTLLLRPVEFCKDSNGERFYYNKDKIKVFQADTHRSQYILNENNEKIKIKEGMKLETDRNGEFYVDSKNRMIYTKYFFEDEYGRYYIDIHGSRHYQTDPRASEYAIVNGEWIKIKEGTYEVDEKGLRIPDEKDTSKDTELEDFVEDIVMGEQTGKPSKISDEQFKYIQEVLRPIIVKACAACYLNKPSRPVQYFAEFIRNYQENQRMFENREKELKQFLELREQMKEKK